MIHLDTKIEDFKTAKWYLLINQNDVFTTSKLHFLVTIRFLFATQKEISDIIIQADQNIQQFRLEFRHSY